MEAVKEVTDASIMLTSPTNAAAKRFKNVWLKLATERGLPAPALLSDEEMKTYVTSIAVRTPLLSLVVPTSTSTPQARGFRVFVGCVLFRPGQVMTITNIDVPASWRKTNTPTSAVDICKYVSNLLEQNHTTPVSSDAKYHNDVHKVRLGFESETQRDMAMQYIQRIPLDPKPICYARRPVTLVRKVFSSVEGGIVSLLAPENLARLSTAKSVPMTILFWADNADSITVVKFALIDEQGIVFHTKRSEVFFPALLNCHTHITFRFKGCWSMLVRSRHYQLGCRRLLSIWVASERSILCSEP
jgi:hypothetical protein